MATVPTDKLKAAETALTQIERQFGKGSIMRLGAKEFVPISAISTGSIGVDAALGVGGVPRGGIIGQDHHFTSRDRRGPESGWVGSVHRRGTCARCRVRQEARRGHRQPAGL